MLNLKEKYAKRSMLACLKAFPLRFKNMPTKRALEVLIELGHSSECVWWVSFNDPTKRFEWTVERFSVGTVMKSFPLARDVTNLEFYGGPSKTLKLYTGTLLALLMDRLLNAMDHVGFKALDAVIPLSESYPPDGGV